MLTRQEIESLVLRLCSTDEAPFAILSCERSADSAYWVVRANDAQCVLHGRTEFCHVGVNAYLVDPSTGEIEVIGSNCSVEQYLTDKNDLLLAGQKKYVLHPAFDVYDPKWVIHLHRKIGGSLPDARSLARNTGWWLTGKKRILEVARDLFALEGIPVNVTLTVNAGMAQVLSDGPLFWVTSKNSPSHEQLNQRQLWVDSAYSRAEIADFEHLKDKQIARAAVDLKAAIGEAAASVL